MSSNVIRSQEKGSQMTGYMGDGRSDKAGIAVPMQNRGS